MKHVKTFESFLNEAATNFVVGDLVKYFSNSSSAPKVPAFGVITKVNNLSASMKILGAWYPKYGGTDDQPNTPMPPNSGLENGMTADEIRNLSGNVVNGYKIKDLTPWTPNIKNINESFLNEAMNNMGPKAKKFSKMVDNLVDSFVDAQENEKEEGGRLPDEYEAAVKKLGIRPDKAMICFSTSVGDWNTILDAAKKTGLKYAEVEDSETNDNAIVFDMNQ
jgi:hypothetical protein